MDTATHSGWAGEELRTKTQTLPHVDIAVAHVRSGVRFSLHIVPPSPGSHMVQFVGLILGGAEGHSGIKQVQIKLHTEIIGRANVDQRSAAWSLANGAPADALVAFTGSLLLTELPRRFVLTLCAPTGGDWEPVAYIRGVHTLQDAAQQRPRFSPLFVTSAGRSGSTMLMKALCASAEIAAPAYYPYETRPLTYYWRVSQIASRPGDHLGSMSPDAFESIRSSVGANPYFTDPFLNSMPDEGLRAWLGSEAPRAMARNAAAVVDAYGDALCASLGKPRARYIAEKILPSSLVNYILAHYPQGKEIFLVRDCRDVLLSSWEYSRKLSVQAFGLGGGTLDEELQRNVSHTKQRARTYLDRRERALLVRYEDLLANPAAEMARIFDYAGLNHADLKAAVAAIHEVEPGHMTSDTREASMQRWRRAFTPEQQASAAKLHREFIEAFGYEK